MYLLSCVCVRVCVYVDITENGWHFLNHMDINSMVKGIDKSLCEFPTGQNTQSLDGVDYSLTFWSKKSQHREVIIRH